MLIGALVVVVAAFVVQRLVSKDERQVRRAIEAAATSADPRRCDQLMTERFLEQVTGEQAPFADDVCEYQADTQAADSVDAEQISVDGDRATALVTYSGGSLDGSTVRLQLVKEDDRWKLDRVLSIEHLDREKARAAWRASLLERGFTERAVDCALDRERRLTDGMLEQVILNDGGAILTSIVIGCDRDGVEHDLVYSIANPDLGVSREGLACVRRRIASATDFELPQYQLSLLSWGRLIVDCDPDVFVDYARRRLRAEGDLDAAEIDCVDHALRGESAAGVIRLNYDEDRFQRLIDHCKLPPHTFRTS